MIIWHGPNAIGLTWPPPEGWDEAQVEAALFGAEPAPTRQPERPRPDFTAMHEHRQKHRHLTQQLGEEYRAANPDGYHTTGSATYINAGAGRETWFC